MCKNCGNTYKEVDTTKVPCCKEYWLNMEEQVLRITMEESESFRLNYVLSLEEKDKRRLA